MADLAKTSQTFDTTKYLRLIILFLHLVFIAYLVVQINQSEELALAKFKELKNMAYFIYIGLFAIIGILIVIKKLTRSYQQSDLLPVLLSNLVISLILTTFSYVLATLIVDLLNLLNFF